MSCITKGNVRCTKCCEAIHINKKQYLRFVKKEINFSDGDFIRKYWTPISKRRAKKINPYIFDRVKKIAKEDYKYVSHDMQFFTCKALKKGFGCTIRDTEEHPYVCKQFGTEDRVHNDYSPTCDFDRNIIARSIL